MDVRRPPGVASKPPIDLKISRRTAETPEQRDSKDTIYGARTIADLSREVLRRVTPRPPEKS